LRITVSTGPRSPFAAKVGALATSIAVAVNDLQTSIEPARHHQLSWQERQHHCHRVADSIALLNDFAAGILVHKLHK
jgi:hypothetical protein